MELEKRSFEIDPIEAELLTAGIAMLMKYNEERIEWHNNHKDYSMDKLFYKMELLARTGDLWVRLQKHQGVTQEEITSYLMEAGN